MNQSHIRNFSIIAHIDHGKSTLADRLLEATGTVEKRHMAEQLLDTMDLERERGITIKAAAVRMDYTPPPSLPSPDHGRGVGGEGTSSPPHTTTPVEEGTGKKEEEDSTVLLPPSADPLPGATSPSTFHLPSSPGGGDAGTGPFELNLIDTPGHVDFTYEVSRALEACQGALLVVDASQGIEAQTLANVYMALELDLTIIPIVNKIDLASAEPERVAQELVDVIGFSADEVIFASAKDGSGVDEILEAIVERIPPPEGDPNAPLRALIFDSKYDSYKGVIAYVAVMDGHLSTKEDLFLMATSRNAEPLEIGVFRPGLTPTESLSAGEVGYVATGLKTVRDCRVGDTITTKSNPAPSALPGYQPAKPMVFAGLYPANSEEYEELRDALEKLQLNDAALQYIPEQSVALGPGFRTGFLGLLHMDIVQERLEREYDLDLLATSPSVGYHVRLTDGSEIEVDSPADMPDPSRIETVGEPWMSVSIVAPDRYIGAIMDLVTNRRGEHVKMEYLERTASAHPEVSKGHPSDSGATSSGSSAGRVVLEYKLPLSEMLVDFYDELKSRTQGYGSLDYSFSHYSPEPLAKLEILVNGVPVDALSLLVHRERAQKQGRALVEKLRSLIPRQMFEIPVQAAIGGKIIARETIRAMRKNVLAKCYGGDVTRKRKLLEKQKAGKKRMKRVGNVDIPQEAFMSLLRIGK